VSPQEEAEVQRVLALSQVHAEAHQDEGFHKDRVAVRHARGKYANASL